MQAYFMVKVMAKVCACKITTTNVGMFLHQQPSTLTFLCAAAD